MQHPEPTQRFVAHASRNPSPDAGEQWFSAMRGGDFPRALACNDAVLRARNPVERDDPTQPYHLRWVWDGRPLAGQDVLVRCYHGLGDTVQFCRFLPAAAGIADRVTLEVQPELLPLLRQLPGVSHLHPFDPARPLPSPGCDLEVMELAHALRVAPDPAPYLRAEPVPGPRGRVGLCWAGGDWDTARSLHPALLAPVLAVPGLRAVSLQRGPAAALLALEDPLAGSMELCRLAGLIAGLDAVVTVDTMVAHLAGALGCPVFLLLKHEPDWRWGAEGAWYRTVRSYKQQRDGDWTVPVATAAADLASLLRGTLADEKGL